MKYLNNWNQINEADEVSKEEPKRSERLLTQAQKESKDSEEVKEKSGPMPAMVFTDVVGSSKMWSDDPVTMSKQLEGHHKLIATISEKYKVHI